MTRNLLIFMGFRYKNTPAAGIRARERLDNGLVLDHRLAMFHERDRWLAVADLHYGYELSHLANGGLLPCWGMEDIRERLRVLLDFYEPRRLILLGDQVHDRRGAGEFLRWLAELRQRCEVVMLRGNHDRKTLKREDLRETWLEEGFVFYHGDREIDHGADKQGRVHIIGHFHPAVVLGDGAGTRVKLPAFVRDASAARERWILPAFSPWAAGGRCAGLGENAQHWACHESGILPLQTL